MLEVGFKAMLATISCPVEIPPVVPPELFEIKPEGDISSLFSVPRIDTTSNPLPISTPLTAFIPIKPCARSASNLSNTGSPKPGGTFLAITDIFAPIESPDFLSELIKFSISGIIFLSGQKKGLFLIFFFVKEEILISPI